MDFDSLNERTMRATIGRYRKSIIIKMYIRPIVFFIFTK
jgi:hypothetical protein